MAAIIWRHEISIFSLTFDIIFEKVNPLTNRLNYGKSYVYLNGKLGAIDWYGTKNELYERIERAKLLSSFLSLFDYDHLSPDEYSYLFQEDGEFSKLSSLLDMSSYGFIKYVKTGSLKRTEREYTDYYCLLSNQQNAKYLSFSAEYSIDNEYIFIEAQKWIESERKFLVLNKKITIPRYFHHCLSYAILYRYLYIILNACSSDIWNGHINNTDFKLHCLLYLPSLEIGRWEGDLMRKFVDLYDLK